MQPLNVNQTNHNKKPLITSLKDITKYFLINSGELIYNQINYPNSFRSIGTALELFSYIWALVLVAYARDFIKSLDKNLSVSQKLIELWRNTFSIFQETLKIQSELKILVVFAFLTIFLASLYSFLYTKSSENSIIFQSFYSLRYDLPDILQYNTDYTRKDNIKTKILNTLFALFFYCALPILGSCFSETIGAFCLGISIGFIISPIISLFCDALSRALYDDYKEDGLSKKLTHKEIYLYPEFNFNFIPHITKFIFELLSNLILNIEEKFIEEPCGKLYNYASELVFGQKNQQVQPE